MAFTRTEDINHEGLSLSSALRARMEPVCILTSLEVKVHPRLLGG